MAEGGHNPSGQNMEQSSEPIIARVAVLAEGDKVSQKFENTTVNVIAGDQHIKTTNNGQAQRGQDTTEPPERNVARYATLAECDQVVQRFENSTVNVVAGDLHVTNVINEPSRSSENALNQERLRLEAGIAFLAKTRRHLRNKVGEHEMPARLTTMVIDMQTANDADFKNEGHGECKTLYGRDVEPINHVQFHDPLKGKYPRHVMILGEAGAGKTTTSEMYCLAVADGHVKTLSSVQLVHYVHAANLDNLSSANALGLLFSEQMALDPMTQLTDSEERAGADWLNENSDKLLLVFDGLDQCVDDFSVKNHPSSSQKNNSRVNQSIASIMAGKLWRGARILTTSRWNIYWNLPVEQKPDKVIGMRGLDDENLKLAASVDSVDGDKLINLLLNTSPKLLNLCRNPMFLKYTTKIFQTDPDNLPDSISGLMAAFFRNFFRLSFKNYDDITRLAYNGMLKNVFVFSRRYLDNLGINPKHLDDFLSAEANPERGRYIANPFDDVFTFAHQTMQEFCCALHVPSLDLRDMKKFIANDLNESGMELTRQLSYGLILNENVTNPMKEYLTGQKTAIQECREIMFEQLLGMVKDGTIHEIQTVRLLSECGNDTVQKMKKHVQRITINVEDLLHSDQILLAIMIKRLSPLKTAFIQQITLDPSMISYVKDCIESVDLFEAGYEIMDSVEEEHFADVMTILNQSKLWYARLRCNDDVKLLFLSNWIERPQVNLDNLGLLGISRVDTLRNLFKFLSIHSLSVLRLNINSRIIGSQFKEIVASHGSITKKVSSMTIEDKSLTDEKVAAYFGIFRHCQFKDLNLGKCDLSDKDISMILRCCRSHDVELQTLGIFDRTMSLDAYSGIAAVVKATKCTHVRFGYCDLSKEDLECFLKTCKRSQVTLQALSILDRTMPPGEYSDVAAVIKATKCNAVKFIDCDLSEEKLNCFRMSCKEMDVSLQKLIIFDRTMPSDAYSDVAAVIKATKCTEMQFSNCDLSEEKLNSFQMSCKEIEVSLQKLNIRDSTMPSDAYSNIADVLKVTKCTIAVFDDCDLSEEKLKYFLESCKKSQVYLQSLGICDNAIPLDVYSDVAAVVKATKCTHVEIDNCNLSREKLKRFGKSCKEGQVSFQKLVIMDRIMPSDAYCEVASVVKAAKCTHVQFIQCDLSKEKLECFRMSCKESQVSLQILAIADRVLPADIYSDVAVVVKDTRCAQVIFSDCDLSKEKLKCFGMSGREMQVSLSHLSIIDTKMSADAYRQIAFTLKSIGCKGILFKNCELTMKKLSDFNRGCNDSDLSLSNLTIRDGAMTSDVYCVVAAIINITGCERVGFGDCDLINDKLGCFGTTGREKGISLWLLQIKDPKMPADAYREIAATLKSIGCKNIQFQDCNLTRRKLSEFYTGSIDNDLSLRKLLIYDHTVPPDAYSAVTDVLKVTKCTRVEFGFCGLSKEKLECFRMSCKESQVSLQTLIIVDPTMSADVYSEVAAVIKDTKSANVTLSECGLSREKLECFWLSCKENKVSISDLSIWNDSVPADAFRVIPTILHDTGCKTVALNHCALTKGKMEAFKSGCEENKLSIPTLEIDWSHSTATEDEISVLCDLMTFAVQKITLFNWNIDVEGSRRLKDTLQLVNSKVTSLKLPNGETFTKRQPAEEPNRIAMQISSIQEMPEIQPIRENPGSNTIQQNQQRVASRRDQRKRCLVQ